MSLKLHQLYLNNLNRYIHAVNLFLREHFTFDERAF